MPIGSYKKRNKHLLVVNCLKGSKDFKKVLYFSVGYLTYGLLYILKFDKSTNPKLNFTLSIKS